MADPIIKDEKATPNPSDAGQTGPGPTGPSGEGATGAGQTGAGQTGPENTGATGPAATGAGASGPEEVSIDKLKKAALDAVAAWQANKTPETKAAADKAVADAKAALKAELGEKAPEKYELKLPKDSVLDTAHLERIAAEAKARGLSNDDAQALLERDNALFSVFAKEEKTRVEGYITQWAEDSKNDKEIGGVNFKKNSELAFRVVQKYGTPELAKFLADTGLGNHPEAVRVFVKIGKLMGDDQFETPGGQNTPEGKSIAEVFYGKEQKTE